jgi:hypothetical protein
MARQTHGQRTTSVAAPRAQPKRCATIDRIRTWRLHEYAIMGCDADRMRPQPRAVHAVQAVDSLWRRFVPAGRLSEDRLEELAHLSAHHVCREHHTHRTCQVYLCLSVCLPCAPHAQDPSGLSVSVCLSVCRVHNTHKDPSGLSVSATPHHTHRTRQDATRRQESKNISSPLSSRLSGAGSGKPTCMSCSKCTLHPLDVTPHALASGLMLHTPSQRFMRPGIASRNDIYEQPAHAW